MDYFKAIDYSSLDTYIKCPRKFLFQYVMHLRSRVPSIDLVFGSCWHYALEQGYKHLATATEVGQATTPERLSQISESAFNALWSIEGAPHWPDEDLVFPKSPGHAANMLHAYWKQELPRFTGATRIIGIEAPFNIDLGIIKPGLPVYTGRMDLVVQDGDQLSIIDHKTTKSISAITHPGFEISMQTDGYLTAGHMYYDCIPTMTYSIALCQKSKIAFHQYRIIKAKYAIDRFLYEVAELCDDIHNNLNLFQYELQDLTSRRDIIASFPRRPGYACTAYFRTCPYFNICGIRNNPLLWHNDPPQGYDINEWDPSTHEEGIKQRLKEAYS